MLDKHAIWCQCALITWCIFAGASLFSIQSLTFKQDIYWFFLFGIASTIHFIAAEHGVCVRGPVFWNKWSRRTNFVLCGVISTWCVGDQWYIQTHVLCIGMYIFFSLFDHPKLWCMFIPQMLYSGSVYFAIIIALQSPFVNIDINKKSFASFEMKYISAKKSTGILLQGYALWYLRCASRFPMTFRWAPVCIGLGSMVVSMVYSAYMVAPTNVSRNAIVQRPSHVRHCMAFSLTAANACPECRKYITSLDMESSFGE
jgi:hypothetical protein